MKRALLISAIIATGSLAACGFDTRADSFRCVNNDDCDQFRRCLDGFCQVLGSDCHPDCDSCNNGTCIMDCSEPGSCTGVVRCPPSARCQVLCSGTDSCRGGIDCSQATRCTADCLGPNACAGPIDCAISECEIDCRGAGSCSGSVDCSDACACDSTCTDGSGNRTCLPQCPSGCDNGTDCVSDGCNECPG